MIRQILELSTAHLPQSIMDNLTTYGSRAYRTHELDSLIVFPYGDDVSNGEYTSEFRGAFVLVPEGVATEGTTRTIPYELWTVLRYAAAAGCELVCFDPDGDREDDLPTWEW